MGAVQSHLDEYLGILKVVEAACRLFRGGHFLGSHFIAHLALNLLLALLARLDAMKPAQQCQLTGALRLLYTIDSDSLIDSLHSQPQSPVHREPEGY